MRPILGTQTFFGPHTPRPIGRTRSKTLTHTHTHKQRHYDGVSRSPAERCSPWGLPQSARPWTRTAQDSGPVPRRDGRTGLQPPAVCEALPHPQPNPRCTYRGRATPSLTPPPPGLQFGCRTRGRLGGWAAACAIGAAGGTWAHRLPPWAHAPFGRTGAWQQHCLPTHTAPHTRTDTLLPIPDQEGGGAS